MKPLTLDFLNKFHQARGGRYGRAPVIEAKDIEIANWVSKGASTDLYAGRTKAGVGYNIEVEAYLDSIRYTSSKLGNEKFTYP
jgi:hypothetical protein